MAFEGERTKGKLRHIGSCKKTGIIEIGKGGGESPPFFEVCGTNRVDGVATDRAAIAALEFN